MGLMDILSGMQNGPGGQRQPSPQGQSGGMSPIWLALLGLLADKGMKGGGLGSIFGGQQAPAGSGYGAPRSGGRLGGILGNIFGGNAGGTPGATPPRVPAGGTGAPGGSSGLGGLLGGLLGGATAGSILNGGLGQVINDLQRSGHGRIAQSWVERGYNEPIDPDDLGRALGADTIGELSRDTGMPQNELLQGLSQNLPDFVDQLTPDGRLPTDDEASRW